MNSVVVASPRECKAWFGGREYDFTKSEDILALQDKLADAQERSAVNDACAIGHTFAVGAAMLLDALKEATNDDER